MIAGVGVVVPAHDEEDLLPTSLDAVVRTLDRCRERGLETRIVVALDRCTDRSAELAGAALARLGERATLVEGRFGSAGAARRAAFDRLLQPFCDGDSTSLWLATTDADTVVGGDWLERQIAAANAGFDAVAGTVEVRDWHEQPQGTPLRFRRLYAPEADPGHPHVHGANLGFRASSYRLAGEMPGLPVSEDRAMIDALASVGARILRTTEIPVTTSARREPRAQGGFGDFLRAL